ncbi:MAG: hypothetical protein WC595_02040 [Candidatus Nanoarchaeia archaeon]
MDHPSYLKRTNIFQVRLSTPELEQVTLKARARGFETVSDYFRYIVFHYDLVIEQKIIETNAITKKILEKMEHNQPK